MDTLIGIVLNLSISLGSMDVMMMFILPVHGHGMCFHLFVSSLISFFNVLQFSECRSFTSLVRFILMVFIFLVALVNGILFLVSLSDNSFLVYQNAINFWVLTLYPATLQIHLLGQVVFWWRLQGFLRTLSCHLQIMTVLLPSLQF